MSAGRNECYEVIVVGAGVQGSSTAYYLAQKAEVVNVLLLDQVLYTVERIRRNVCNTGVGVARLWAWSLIPEHSIFMLFSLSKLKTGAC